MTIDGIGYTHTRADILDESPAWFRWAIDRLRRARKAIADARKTR